nr:hypothetical protein Iba_chr04dCG16170 [Ipomoea batatas]
MLSLCRNPEKHTPIHQVLNLLWRPRSLQRESILRGKRSGPTVGPEQPPPPAPCGLPPLGSGDGGGGDLSNPSPVPHASPPSGGGNAGSGGGDVHDTTLAETTHTQEEVHDTEAQEANTKDFDADLDDHLVKNPTKIHNEDDLYTSPTQVDDSSTHGDVTVPIISPVAQRTEVVPVAKRTRKTQSTSEQSNVAGFYREASDDDSDSLVTNRVATFEFTGHYRESARGNGSPPKTSILKCYLVARSLDHQTRPFCIPISSQRINPSILNSYFIIVNIFNI